MLNNHEELSDRGIDDSAAAATRDKHDGEHRLMQAATKAALIEAQRGSRSRKLACQPKLTGPTLRKAS